MTANLDTRSRFKTRWHDRRPRYWLRKDPPRISGFRAAPEVVRFDVAPDATPSGKPTVRIFLGTEPMQARAERVFLWSVSVHRDPSRTYEVHLMRDLAGFDRERWTTGFTNYRFAIPALAGETGRAIYNDVDQIYLADPAELFDLDMKGAGVLSIDAGETSVALIDCAAMAKRWHLDDARTIGRRRHFLAPLADDGVWGPMSGDWNARDDEYRPGQSKCLHFTTLRLQPWRPFPDQFRYKAHPDASVWEALEASADAARFTAFSRRNPSSDFAGSARSFRESPPPAFRPEIAEAVADISSASGATRLLECRSGRAAGAETVESNAHVTFPAEPLLARRFDGVICDRLLCRLPEDDVPWALDELFAAAETFVFVAVELDAARDGSAAALGAEWWRLQLRLAGQRAPGKAWRLAIVGADRRKLAIHDSPDVGSRSPVPRVVADEGVRQAAC